jgi:16S rRNA (uracil1498-N3)-methyltransferase
MTRRRWIADEFSENQAALTGAHAEHLIRVLRARVGEEFDISAGAAVRHGRVTNLGDGRVEFELGEVVPAVAAANVTLVLSIFKFDRMEWAMEKCTELGVARIVPVVASRTEVHLATAAVKRWERWQRIAMQASEQSRRSAPPEILQSMKLKDAVNLRGQTRILLAESEKEVRLKDALAAHSPSESPALSQKPREGRGTRAEGVMLAIGPEGGWTESELDLFQQAGWVPASLGSAILRAETAAIAAMAVVIAEIQ